MTSFTSIMISGTIVFLIAVDLLINSGLATTFMLLKLIDAINWVIFWR